MLWRRRNVHEQLTVVKIKISRLLFDRHRMWWQWAKWWRHISMTSWKRALILVRPLVRVRLKIMCIRHWHKTWIIALYFCVSCAATFCFILSGQSESWDVAILSTCYESYTFSLLYCYTVINYNYVNKLSLFQYKEFFYIYILR